eukprot:TRINITY_DN14223_c0_g1_i2.p1 TRINITY_DN14223_c0_g1~~TRINITY_DN14223_c0_g1_i2.p1  ORF type:complete len:403 (+),score=73.33 TRINITY_DN14223_c0_g1_i2:155-1210(+)
MPWSHGSSLDEPVKVNLTPTFSSWGCEEGYPQKVPLPNTGLGALSGEEVRPLELEEIWSQKANAWGTSWLEPGTLVVFQGLRVAQELNGQCGIVEGWDLQSNRWTVRMADGQTKFARTDNLMAVATPSVLKGSLPASTGYLDTTGLPASSNGEKHGKRAQQGDLLGHTKSEPTTSPGSELSSLRSSVCSSMEHSCLAEAKQLQVPSPPTTVMMRNIPSEYTGVMLLKLLDSNGFKCCYDLVYLPMDYHNQVGFGYAFINFVSAEEAERFREVFEGFCEWGLVSDKVCEVCWSNVLQGVEAHIERYRNSPVMHPTVPDAFKPMLFSRGEQVAFPAPTKTVRPPRLRKKGQQA